MDNEDSDLNDSTQKLTKSILNELLVEDPDSGSILVREDVDVRTAFAIIHQKTNEFFPPSKEPEIDDNSGTEIDDNSVPRNLRKRRKIVSFLLRNKEAKVSEIADHCGYDDRDNHRHDYVSKVLRQMRDKDGYLCSERKKPSPDWTGRTPTYYWIKPDLHTIQTLYNDSKYESLSPEFCHSTWLVNLIIDTNFESDFHDNRELITRMIGASRSFFEYCLNSKEKMSIDDLNSFILDFDAMYPSILSFSEDNTDYFDYPPTDILLYHFFLLCTFADKCRSDFQTSHDELEVRRLAGEAREKMTIYQDDSNTAEKIDSFIDGMQKLIDQCELNENGDLVVPDDIIEKIDEYETFLERYLESDPQDQHLKKDVDAICNEIMGMMDSPLRRREEEEEDGS